jgi:hypothetical protein
LVPKVAPKALRVVVSVLASLMAVRNRVAEGEPQHRSRTELRGLIAKASTPAECQPFAAHFHFQEELCHAKAQVDMRESAACVRNITIVPNFPSRADQTARSVRIRFCQGGSRREAGCTL